MSEQILCGTGFIGDAYSPENIEIIIEDGMIKEVNPSSGETSEYILPAFFNAHTHIGDTVALDTPVSRPLAELVAPPNGLKHRILRETTSEDLMSGMKATMSFMKRTGTLGFADFREGGPDGVHALSSGLDPALHACIFGRDGGELLFAAQGFGLTSAHGTKEEEDAVTAARKAEKLVAVHAGEVKHDDIEAAFSLEPDVIIHATYFDDTDIRRAADEDIMITICPRSNWILRGTSSSALPPVRKMLNAGVRVSLGTDNAMFVSSDMFAECAFLMTVYKATAKEAMLLATRGFELLRVPSGIAVGNPANLTVLSADRLYSWSINPLATALTRSSVAGIVSAKCGFESFHHL
ncbi:MAG TPA: amidohydrolase family protein [Methanocorpusculum sp.]|nr:amidohydrolase family protein [Methanocorpusculum sp.]